MHVLVLVLVDRNHICKFLRYIFDKSTQAITKGYIYSVHYTGVELYRLSSNEVTKSELLIISVVLGAKEFAVLECRDARAAFQRRLHSTVTACRYRSRHSSAPIPSLQPLCPLRRPRARSASSVSACVTSGSTPRRYALPSLLLT